MFVCRELQREKTWSRIHLVPLLLAEGDRDTYRRQQAALAREKEIMKDVKGWQVRIPIPMRVSELGSLIDCAFRSFRPASLRHFFSGTFCLDCAAW